MPSEKYILSLITGLFLFIPSILIGQSVPFLSYEVQPGAGCAVLVRWEISAGADTLNFEVERSTDKQSWKVISRERIRSTHKYVVFDTQPADSINFYRVKQVGKINSSIYSTVKSIQLFKAYEIYMWPNPVSEVLNVTTPFLSGTMDIIDTNGILVRKIIIVDFNNTISTIGLASGVYFLHIRHADLYTVQRFVKE